MAATPSIELETYEYRDGVNLDVARDPSTQLESTSPQKKKTLVFFHGGGLVSGSRRGRFPPLPVKLLLERGWVVIVPDYRLLPEASISDILDDLKQLENWMVQNSVRLGFDKGNLAVGGSSAGSFVSILAISTWTQVRPRALYGLWSMVNTADEWYSRIRDDDERIGPMLAGSLLEANFLDLLKPGNPQISDDQVGMTDPRSRSAFFLWLLKTGELLPFIHGHRSEINPECYLGKIGSIINTSLREAIGTENPLDLVDSSFPPAVLVHGTADTVAPLSDSCELSKRLQALDVQSRLFEADGADHGIAPQEQYRKVFEDSVEALGGYFY